MADILHLSAISWAQWRGWLISDYRRSTHTHFRGACDVVVIVVGNGHGDTSSNPGQIIAFHLALMLLGKYESKDFSPRYG